MSDTEFELMLCVGFIDPDGHRFDFVAKKVLHLVPRVGERINLGRKPWNVLVVRDVTHQLDGGSTVLICEPLVELDNNAKRKDMFDLLVGAGFKEITSDVNQRSAEWRERGERRG